MNSSLDCARCLAKLAVAPYGETVYSKAAVTIHGGEALCFDHAIAVLRSEQASETDGVRK